jgi:DNA-directed RNA polymerase II subunit RPB2
MTIGHLIESVLSKYACYSGNIIDGTVFENNDNKTYFEELGKKGYQKHGNELLYNGYSGDQIKADIFFGPTFYFCLKHMVKDKINYRGGKVDPSKNPVTGTTRQPTHGRANKGGLRIGEMETNALLGHGIGSFIKESMMERSDEYTYALDVQNGTIASHISKKDDDSVCERKPEITNVSTPFSFKLLTQEVAALGIKASLRVNKTSTQKENENIEDDLYYIDEDLEED